MKPRRQRAAPTAPDTGHDGPQALDRAAGPGGRPDGGTGAVRRDGAQRDATTGPRIVPPALERAAAWSWRLLLVAAATWLVVEALVRLRLVVLPVIAALFAATVLVPPRRWLTARGMSPLPAALIVFVAAVVLLGGTVAALAPGIAAQGEELGGTVADGIATVEDWLRDRFGVTGQEVDRVIDRAGQQLQENAGGIAGGVLSGAVAAGEAIAGLLLTAVVLFFVVKDGDRIAAWMLERVPAARRPLARRLGTRSWAVLGAYVRGQALVGVVDAAVIGIGLWLLDVPLVLPLAVLTFFGAFLPLIGAVLAGIVAALVALVAGGLTKALLVIGLVVVVQQLEGDLLAPLILGRAVELHPLAIVLVLSAGAVLGGVVGAVLSVPLAAVAVGVTSELRGERTAPPWRAGRPRGHGRGSPAPA